MEWPIVLRDNVAWVTGIYTQAGLSFFLKKYLRDAMG